ncbi:MAG: class 1 fructose-bisphosphatase [Candidatus Pacebacteria bacterium]|nr:class 1 fructose-bisphosphatase [Candidatus Paceibacterota bacterium]
MHKITNISTHLYDLHTFSQKSLELADVLNQIVLAAKFVSREVNKAGLTDILGAAGHTNVQDEQVQKLDVYTNEIFIELMRQSPHVKAVGSEEEDKIIIFKGKNKNNAKYIVHLDPLDGSSNIDVNVSVGTNFAIFEKKSKGKGITKEDYLQKGKDVIAAGYVVYGSSTMLVYSSGKGVHGFTLDPSIGEFILSHENIMIPKESTIYSINESYEPKWKDDFTAHIKKMKTNDDISGKAKTARYIGSLVADFHRNLLKGGIYLYPADKKSPNGKLRLLYEGIPFAFLAKHAGGYASNGQMDVLEIEPTELHQRIPLFVGNTKDVKAIEKLLKI